MSRETQVPITQIIHEEQDEVGLSICRSSIGVSCLGCIDLNKQEQQPHKASLVHEGSHLRVSRKMFKATFFHRLVRICPLRSLSMRKIRFFCGLVTEYARFKLEAFSNGSKSRLIESLFVVYSLVQYRYASSKSIATDGGCTCL